MRKIIATVIVIAILGLAVYEMRPKPPIVHVEKHPTDYADENSATFEVIHHGLTVEINKANMLAFQEQCTIESIEQKYTTAALPPKVWMSCDAGITGSFAINSWEPNLKLGKTFDVTITLKERQ